MLRHRVIFKFHYQHRVKTLVSKYIMDLKLLLPLETSFSQFCELTSHLEQLDYQRKIIPCVQQCLVELALHTSCRLPSEILNTATLSVNLYA